MDSVSRDTRSKIMSKVRSKNTKLERRFYSALISKGITGLDCNPSDLFGKPDLVHKKSKTAIFLDSCFWHGCPKHLRMPRTNSEYWRKKIERNKKRDGLVTRTLRRNSWSVVRIWEHSLRNEADLEKGANKVFSLIIKKSQISEEAR